MDVSLPPSTPEKTVSPPHTPRQRLNYLKKTAPEQGIGLRLKAGVNLVSHTTVGWGLTEKLSISTSLGALVTLLPSVTFSFTFGKRRIVTVGAGEADVTIFILHVQKPRSRDEMSHPWSRGTGCKTTAGVRPSDSSSTLLPQG